MIIAVILLLLVILFCSGIPLINAIKGGDWRLFKSKCEEVEKGQYKTKEECEAMLNRVKLLEENLKIGKVRFPISPDFIQDIQSGGKLYDQYINFRKKTNLMDQVAYFMNSYFKSMKNRANIQVIIDILHKFNLEEICYTSDKYIIFIENISEDAKRIRELIDKSSFPLIQKEHLFRKYQETGNSVLEMLPALWLARYESFIIKSISPAEITKLVHECQNRFIIIHISIKFREPSHANQLIIDTISKKIYINDPVIQSIDSMVSDFKFYLKPLFDDGYQLISMPTIACPRSLQSATGGKICQTWSIYATLMIILNPMIDPAQILSQFIDEYAYDKIITFMFYLYITYNKYMEESPTLYTEGFAYEYERKNIEKNCKKLNYQSKIYKIHGYIQICELFSLINEKIQKINLKNSFIIDLFTIYKISMWQIDKRTPIDYYIKEIHNIYLKLKDKLNEYKEKYPDEKFDEIQLRRPVPSLEPAMRVITKDDKKKDTEFFESLQE